MTTATNVSHKRLNAFRQLDGTAADGTLRAVFSTFDIEDRDGDVVRKSAFTDGQEVPLVWAHDWTKPIGKGVVRVESTRAVFDGQLFTTTTAGKEAHELVKSMGNLLEYSWGFRVTKTQPNRSIQGIDIVAAEVFEVSPVLVGANPMTGTIEVKERGLGSQQPVLDMLAMERISLEAMGLGLTMEFLDDPLNMLERERLQLEAIGLR